MEAQHNSKYAKWKAAYIHNCLKNGETPIAGPMPSEDDEVSNFAVQTAPNPAGGAAGPFMGFQPFNPQQPPQGPYQPPQAHYFEPPPPTNHTFSNDPFLASNIRAPSPPKVHMIGKMRTLLLDCMEQNLLVASLVPLVEMEHGYCWPRKDHY